MRNPLRLSKGGVVDLMASLSARKELIEAPEQPVDEAQDAVGRLLPCTVGGLVIEPEKAVPVRFRQEADGHDDRQCQHCSGNDGIAADRDTASGEQRALWRVAVLVHLKGGVAGGEQAEQERCRQAEAGYPGLVIQNDGGEPADGPCEQQDADDLADPPPLQHGATECHHDEGENDEQDVLPDDQSEKVHDVLLRRDPTKLI